MSLKLVLSLSWLTLLLAALQAEPATRLGVLQATGARAEALSQGGVELAVVGVSWDRFEPSHGVLAAEYVASLRAEIAALRGAGLEVILDLGVQYPPDWLFETPGSRYVNQFGEAYVDPSPGKNVANAVFNAAIREAQAMFYARVLAELGTEFYALRLGGGWYNELNYPPHEFADQRNCYWAFCERAQGKAPGLPEGVPPCPVAGWQPGGSTTGLETARRFAEWYMEALRNYHDWQITTLRALYPGRLMMLYPSWGIRPGQLEAAIAGGLAGTTPPERNGEIQRGFDFARFVRGITDPHVVLTSTWTDADPSFGDDASEDPAVWSPPHYLSSLARAHSPPLELAGENTGGGGPEVARLCAERSRSHGLTVFLWAFQEDLFNGEAPDLADLRAEFGGRAK